MHCVGSPVKIRFWKFQVCKKLRRQTRWTECFLERVLWQTLCKVSILNLVLNRQCPRHQNIPSPAETIQTNSVTVSDETHWLQEFQSWRAKFSFCLWYPICCSVLLWNNKSSKYFKHRYLDISWISCIASPCPLCSHPIRTSWPTLGYLFQHLWAIDFHWSSVRNTTWQNPNRDDEFMQQLWQQL